MRGKTSVKKGPPKKAVSVVAVETKEGYQQSPMGRNHVREVRGELSPVRETSRWSRGRV